MDGRGSAVIEEEVVDLEPNSSNCLAEEAEGFLATKIWDPGGVSVGISAVGSDFDQVAAGITASGTVPVKVRACAS